MGQELSSVSVKYEDRVPELNENLTDPYPLGSGAVFIPMSPYTGDLPLHSIPQIILNVGLTSRQYQDCIYEINAVSIKEYSRVRRSIQKLERGIGSWESYYDHLEKLIFGVNQICNDLNFFILSNYNVLLIPFVHILRDETNGQHFGIIIDYKDRSKIEKNRKKSEKIAMKQLKNKNKTNNNNKNKDKSAKSTKKSNLFSCFSFNHRNNQNDESENEENNSNYNNNNNDNDKNAEMKESGSGSEVGNNNTNNNDNDNNNNEKKSDSNCGSNNSSNNSSRSNTVRSSNDIDLLDSTLQIGKRLELTQELNNNIGSSSVCSEVSLNNMNINNVSSCDIEDDMNMNMNLNEMNDLNMRMRMTAINSMSENDNDNEDSCDSSKDSHRTTGACAVSVGITQQQGVVRVRSYTESNASKFGLSIYLPRHMRPDEYSSN